MSENTTLSQPADAGKGIVERIRRFFGQEYNVLEMPILRNSVRMELVELKRFCKQGSFLGLPLFCLKVEENVHDGIAFPVASPYHKWFTVYGEWCFYAVERINPEPKEVKQ